MTDQPTRREALEAWYRVKDRDPNDPLTQLEIMRDKATQEGCGVEHQYNVLRNYILNSTPVPEERRRLALRLGVPASYRHGP